MANSHTRLSLSSLSAALDVRGNKLRQSCPHSVSQSPAQRCRHGPGQQEASLLALAQQQLDDLQRERDFLAARVAAIKVQLDVQTAHAASAEAKLRRAVAELESIKRVQSQRVTSSAQFKELKAAAATAKQGLRTLEASVQANQQRLQERRQQVCSLQGELQLALQREEQSALALAAVHDSLGCNSAALAALQQQLQHSQAEADLLRAQVAAADEAAAQLLQAAQAEVAAMQEQLSKAQAVAQQQRTIATKALGVALAARFAAAQLAEHNQQLQHDLDCTARQLDKTAAAADSTSKQLRLECQAAEAAWQAHASTQQELQAAQAELAACTEQLEAVQQHQQQQHSTPSVLPDLQLQPHSDTHQEPYQKQHQTGMRGLSTEQQQQQHQEQQQEQKEQPSCRPGQPHRRCPRSQPAAASTAALQQELAACQAQLQEQRRAADAARAAMRGATFEIAKLEAQRKHLHEQHSAAAAAAAAAAETISSLRAQVQQHQAQCQLLQQKPQAEALAAGLQAGSGQQQEKAAADCSGLYQVFDDLANVQDCHSSSQQGHDISEVQQDHQALLCAALYTAAAATATAGVPLHSGLGLDSGAHTELSRHWGSGLCVASSGDGGSANGVSSGSRTPATCTSWYSCCSVLPAEGSQTCVQGVQDQLEGNGGEQL